MSPPHLRLIEQDEEPLPVFLARIRAMTRIDHKPAPTGILPVLDYEGREQRFNTKRYRRPYQLPVPASIEGSELLAEDERQDILRRRAAALKRMSRDA